MPRTTDGLNDVAWEHALTTGDRSILMPTSEYDRIDIAYVTPNLTPAITSYRTLTSPEEASDHHAVAFTLDTVRAATGGEFAWC